VTNAPSSVFGTDIAHGRRRPETGEASSIAKAEGEAFLNMHRLGDVTLT